MAEKIIHIYKGRPENFRYAVFLSGSGTNARECSRTISPALVFSDRPKAKGLTHPEFKGVEKIVLNGYEACGSWKAAQGNPDAEAEYQRRSLEYNHQILDKLQDFEKKEGPLHLIVLGGYMRMVGEPLLEAYPDKIINVHPADLSILVDDKRQLIGEDAVYDAIRNGYHSTRSSVIMVDEGVDHGEILTRGPRIKVWNEFIEGTDAEKAECLREYADAHQSFQKVRSDWPALTTALKMISEGRIALGSEKTSNFSVRRPLTIIETGLESSKMSKGEVILNTEYPLEWRRVYVDDEPMPYGGHEVEKAA